MVSRGTDKRSDNRLDAQTIRGWGRRSNYRKVG